MALAGTVEQVSDSFNVVEYAMLMSVFYSLRLRVGLQSPELVLLAMLDALKKTIVGFGFLSTYFPRGRLFLDLKMLIHS